MGDIEIWTDVKSKNVVWASIRPLEYIPLTRGDFKRSLPKLYESVAGGSFRGRLADPSRQDSIDYLLCYLTTDGVLRLPEKGETAYKVYKWSDTR